METVRSCGCKGIRTCLICEKEYSISKPTVTNELQSESSYVYCPACDGGWPGWNVEDYKQHPNHVGEAIEFPGVYIKLDFLNEHEADSLIKSLDALPWEPSQSGRRKQNYGPKCNFKKRRLRLGSFAGFPQSTKFVQDKFSEISLLRDFRTVEQCSLEYNPKRGASIDPHIDDCWIWGERIVTVNVLGDSVLTMIPYIGSATRYNLKDVLTYPTTIRTNSRETKTAEIDDIKDKIIVRLPMPARSLMILYGPARYDWEHAVLREDTVSRRVCLAYRELTPPYLPHGVHSEEASEILKKALNFWPFERSKTILYMTWTRCGTATFSTVCKAVRRVIADRVSMRIFLETTFFYRIIGKLLRL